MKEAISYGVTSPVPHSKVVKVYISVEVLQLLLRDDLTPSER